MDQDPPHQPPDQEDCVKHTAIKKCKSSPALQSHVSGNQPSPPPFDGLGGGTFAHPESGLTSVDTGSPPSPSPRYISVCPPLEISCPSTTISSSQQSSQASDLTNAGPLGFPPTTPPGNPPGSASQTCPGASGNESSTRHSQSSVFNKTSPPGFPPNHFPQASSQVHSVNWSAFFGYEGSRPHSTFGNRSPPGFPPHFVSGHSSGGVQASFFADPTLTRPPPGFLRGRPPRGLRYARSTVSGNTLQPSPFASAATFGRRRSLRDSPLAHINNTPYHFSPGFPTRPVSGAANQSPPGASAAIFGSERAPPSGYLPKMSGKCFSIASIRVYDRNLRCDRCGRGSDLGFFYRCVHNVDARLFESIAEGNREHFDEIGAMFSQQLKPPARGAAARQDKLSPLEEMTPEQLETYTAPQLATVLRQHEGAVNNALVDRHGPFLPYAGDKPYLEPLRDECTATLCPSCGRAGAGEDLSFLSIDGVLKDDIPPSAAVGYGFRGMGGRPVANAHIVKNLGLRDPKTGLLPEQAQKIKEAEEVRKAAEVAGSTGSEKLDVAAEAVQTTEPQEEALVQLAESLSIGDKEASTPFDTDSSKIPSETPPETPPKNSIYADDSNEDVIQLYAESCDEPVLSSCAPDTKSEPYEEDFASVKATEALDAAENDEVASR